MRIAAVGVIALLTVAFAGDGLAQSLQDEIQEEEQPGSEIEAEIGRGGIEIGRERDLTPIERGGETPLELPNDPDMPVAPDAVDAELPGEGPENLSGPDDNDPLPE